MTRNPLLTITAISAAALSLALGACNRNEERTVGERVDATVAATQDKAAEVRDDLRAGAASASDQAQAAMDATRNAAGDAAITTAINAELARDPGLSALRINVDTQDGRVLLKGSAPDDDARARATVLAQGVKGVVTVDNQLAVTPKS